MFFKFGLQPGSLVNQATLQPGIVLTHMNIHRAWHDIAASVLCSAWRDVVMVTCQTEVGTLRDMTRLVICDAITRMVLNTILSEHTMPFTFSEQPALMAFGYP